MTIRIIKSQDDYLAAIKNAEALAVSDPESGTKESEQLELLALVIEDFEKRHYKFEIPDPISAIEFRMEEQGLRQRDLIPILGSRSRVSEVLSRKRPLTLPMIRSLAESLGIPTDVLVRGNDPSEVAINEPDEPAWSKFPFQEMQKRGWIKASPALAVKDVEILVKQFLAEAGRLPATAPLYRKNLKGLGFKSLDDKAKYSSYAWIARILQKAETADEIHKFSLNKLSEEYLRQLATLSRYPDGPIRAINQLKAIGIRVVIEPRLPNSLIDGAAMLSNDLQPVIGMTLRYDRADYFWFTLLHEVAHVWKHLNTSDETFIDRIDADEDEGRIEKEANKIAREALIPRAIWNKSSAKLNPSISSITNFAEQMEIHPAIVAGRIRYETAEFNRFAKLLGQGTIRRLFSDTNFH